VVNALKRQAEKLITCPNVFYNDERYRLLRKLVEITPPRLTRAFLCNSGAECTEAAIKFSRYTTKKTDFVCATRGFHGRTLGALSATFKPEAPLTIEYPEIDVVIEKLTEVLK
jgi:acetylornithine/LysW-gamma-L-lysine aminotransferase